MKNLSRFEILSSGAHNVILGHLLWTISAETATSRIVGTREILYAVQLAYRDFQMNGREDHNECNNSA